MVIGLLFGNYKTTPRSSMKHVSCIYWYFEPFHLKVEKNGNFGLSVSVVKVRKQSSILATLAVDVYQTFLLVIRKCSNTSPP